MGGPVGTWWRSLVGAPDASPLLATAKTGWRSGMGAPIAVGLLALVLRLVYVAQVHGTPVMEVLLIDSAYYHAEGQRIAAGGWVRDDVFFMNAAYPYFLAAIYAAFGPSPLAAALVQSAVGSASAVLAWAIARRMAGAGVGWFAGIACAVWPTWILYDAALLTPTLVTFFDLVAVVLLLQVQQAGAGEASAPADRVRPAGSLTGRPAGASRWRLLAAGLAWGAGCAVRANGLLFVPLLLLWAMARPGAPERRRDRLAEWGWVAAGTGLALAPIAAHNWAAAGVFEPLTANAGMTFYVGNSEAANGIYTQTPFQSTPVPEVEEEEFRAEASRRAGRDLTLAESSRFWAAEGLRWIAANPEAWVRLELTKLRLFWHAVESQTNLSYYFARDFSVLLRAIPPAWGLVAPLALAGMWLRRRRWRGDLLAYLVVAAYLVSCLAVYVASEYRTAVVPFLALFAWHAVAWARRSAIERGPTGRLARTRGGVVAATAVLFLALNVRDESLDRLTRKRADYLNYGTLYLQRGEAERAVELLKRSVAIDPAWPVSRERLARAYLAAGDLESARREAETAQRLAEGVGQAPVDR